MTYRKGRRVHSPTGRAMLYKSECGQYAIRKHESDYGEVIRFSALARRLDDWWPISTHRTRRAAERAILRFLRERKEMFRARSKIGA